jgi:hypothetical protein
MVKSRNTTPNSASSAMLSESSTVRSDSTGQRSAKRAEASAARCHAGRRGSPGPGLMRLRWNSGTTIAAATRNSSTLLVAAAVGRLDHRSAVQLRWMTSL